MSFDEDSIIRSTEPTVIQVVEAPCRIVFKTGRTFVVPDVEAWGYTDMGVQATGRWHDELQGAEEDLQIPYDSIDYIQVDFDALAKFKEHEVARREPPYA